MRLVPSAYFSGTALQPAPNKALPRFPQADPQSCPQKLWSGFYFDLDTVFMLAACFAGIVLKAAPDKALAGLFRGWCTKLSTKFVEELAKNLC